MITADQIKAARSLLGWSMSRLASKARLHPNTIQRAEKIGRYSVATMAKIEAALVSAGIEFTDGDGPGVRMK